MHTYNMHEHMLTFVQENIDLAILLPLPDDEVVGIVFNSFDFSLDHCLPCVLYLCIKYQDSPTQAMTARSVICFCVSSFWVKFTWHGWFMSWEASCDMSHDFVTCDMSHDFALLSCDMTCDTWHDVMIGLLWHVCVCVCVFVCVCVCVCVLSCALLELYFFWECAWERPNEKDWWVSVWACGCACTPWERECVWETASRREKDGEKERLCVRTWCGYGRVYIVRGFAVVHCMLWCTTANMLWRIQHVTHWTLWFFGINIVILWSQHCDSLESTLWFFGVNIVFLWSQVPDS